MSKRKNSSKSNNDKQYESRNDKNSEESVINVESATSVNKQLSIMFEKFASNIHQDINDIKKSIEFMSTKFDSLLSEINNVKDELKEVRKENDFLKREINELGVRLQDLEQYNRRDNIVLYGVPSTNNESVNEIVKTVSTIIGADGCFEDVSVTHRLPTRPGKPRPIVRFAKRSSRDLWLSRFREEAKNNKEGFGLPTQTICQQFQPGLVTASDHLTPFMKNLFNKTKLTAREKGYKFTWVKDCKIFVRKNENSQVNRVFDYYDLEKL